MMRFAILCCCLIVLSGSAQAQQSTWMWWGATNPVPVSAANPLPVTPIGGASGMLTNGSNATAAALGNIVTIATGCNDVSKVVSGIGTCVTPSAGSPASPDTSLQYNNGGAFGGTGLLWDGTGLTTATLFSVTEVADGLTLALTATADDFEQSPGLAIRYTNGFSGIGISPAATTAGASYIDMISFGDGGGSLDFVSYGGVAGTPTAITNGTSIAYFGVSGWDGSTEATAATMQISSAEDFSSGHAGAKLQINTTAVGTANNLARLQIDGSGSTNILNGGLIIGTPTGGSQGAGTVNASGLYINGSDITTLFLTTIFTTASPITLTSTDTTTGFTINGPLSNQTIELAGTTLIQGGKDGNTPKEIRITGIVGGAAGEAGGPLVFVSGDGFDNNTNAGDITIVAGQTASGGTGRSGDILIQAPKGGGAADGEVFLDAALRLNANKLPVVGAGTGKKFLCVDNSTGQVLIYISTGVSCN